MAQPGSPAAHSGASSAWTSTVVRAQVNSDQGPLRVKTQERGDLNAIVQGLVKTNVFQAALNSRPHLNTLNVTILVTGDRIKVVNKFDPRDVILDTYQNTTIAPQQLQQLGEVSTRVTNFATQYLQTKQAPSVSQSESQAMCAQQHVEGMNNNNNYCYANAAAQILQHVLKAELLDKLPDNKAHLQSLKTAPFTGEQLVACINAQKQADGEQPLPVGDGHDSTEILHYLTSLVSDFSTPAEEKEWAMRWNAGLKCPVQDTAPKVADEPTSIMNMKLRASQGKPSISFREVLEDTLAFSKDSEENLNAMLLRVTSAHPTETFKSEFKFKKSPEHLGIHLGRKDGGRKDARDIDIPLVLNLNDYQAMQEGEAVDALFLKAFTVHAGSGQGNVGGHYVSYFQKQVAKDTWQWFCANDTAVQAVSEQQALAAARQASFVYYDNKVTPSAEAYAQDMEIEAHVTRFEEQLHLFLRAQQELINNIPLTATAEQRKAAVNLYQAVTTEEERQKIEIELGKIYKARHNEPNFPKVPSIQDADSEQETGRKYLEDYPGSKMLRDALKTIVEEKIQDLQHRITTLDERIDA
jgi:hypothetical protein